MDESRIDILLATYNGEAYLAEQIKSIISQSYSNWRLLISDDCSTDHTVEIIKTFTKADRRISLVSKNIRHGSAKDNFESLLKICDSQYVMFCDQDDVWKTDKIRDSLRYLKEKEKEYREETPLLVFCDMEVVDSTLNPIATSFERYSNFDFKKINLKRILTQNIAAGCCMIFNKPVVKLFKESEEPRYQEMHDWWIALIAVSFGYIFFLDKTLSLYRQHGNNQVGAASYSPLKKISKRDLMYNQFQSTMRQASSFLSCFGDRLDENSRYCISEYVKAGESESFLIAIYHFLKSGCWKKGLRKTGQIVMLLLNSRERRKKCC